MRSFTNFSQLPHTPSVPALDAGSIVWFGSALPLAVYGPRARPEDWDDLGE